ncbi:MAG: iron chelate uptake ABC transporter family permease subunit [Rhabdochlamydiaceae bacterium]
MLGTVCMAISSSLVGTIVLLRRRSLIGETLSHAAFPGILVGIFILSFITSDISEWMFLSMTLGGFFFSLLGLKCVDWMEMKWKVKSDSALTFVLAAFMGWGILLASVLQKSHPMGYRQSLLYLYGQAATMTSDQALLYGSFAFVLIAFLVLFYSRLKLINFDSVFAQSLGLRYKSLETATFLLIVIAIILGIRSVGVVLMAGMLIGPAVAARPWSHRFSTMLIISSCFGLGSAFLGNILSYKLVSLPTGPMILLSSSCLCIISLLIAPHSGLLVRLIRIQTFRFRCRMENGLKLVWKKPNLISELSSFIKFSLRMKGWISKENTLTSKGALAAQKIIRLHRLWEVYLVEYLGQNVEKVHRTAEELEHLFSPALEKQLTLLLNNPLKDPHEQPIPPREGS